MSNALDIKIPNIEKELQNLCKSPKDKKQIKACLFTLVIYAHEPKRIKYFQELIDTILDKFPCRIIFIQGDSTASNEYLHVDVANVTSGREEALVMCDQITIKASSSKLSRVPFIVIPHIVPDLPVYLLWSQTPFDEHIIFPALQPYASRIIFDSECSDNLHLFCEEMLQNIQALKTDLMDINWALISNWRDMLVQLFDSPAKLSILQNTKTLKITYNNTKTDCLQHPEIRAIYLQGWLASRLNGKYHRTEIIDGMIIISYILDGLPLIVSLCPQPHGDMPSGALVSIELHSNDGFSFNIARKQALSQVVVHASSPDTCDLPYTLPLPDVHKGLNFMKEIFYHKLSDHYRDMLKVIAKWI